jgi:SAM-dependent methyltransferase
MDMIEYYSRRAAGYDKLYHRAERKEALDEAEAILADIFRNKNILEIACGTGYWTERIAATAQSILAVDINESMLEIARQRKYPKGNVTFSRSDFYHLSILRDYDALFAGFIWSHILLQEMNVFISLLKSYVAPGGTLVFIDNNFVEGSSTPVHHTDKNGNTYQNRVLDNGEVFTIVKNFPTEDGIQKILADKSDVIHFTKLQYYWILCFQNS